MKEAITPPISEKKNIDAFNKADKSQASNKIVDTPRSNKTDKVKSLDKSRSTQRNDTENTVDKSRSISITSLSNKSIRIEKPTNRYLQRQFKCFYFVWTWRKFIKYNTISITYS